MRVFSLGVFASMVACRAADPSARSDDSGGDLPDDTGTGTETIDADGDGFDAEEDCNDDDVAVHPGAEEVCDDLDNDCSGGVDDGAVDALRWYPDTDGDGFGAEGAEEVGCVVPPGTAEVGGDCDDADVEVYPGQAEQCDGVDNDCDALTAEEGMVTFLSDLGVATDETVTFAAGTVSSPQEYTISQAGTLLLCGGEWYASLEVEAPASIIGIGGASQNVLSGARFARVVEVQADLVLQDVTLAQGQAPGTSQSFGGALQCTSGASLLLDGVVISDSEATHGAGLYLHGCPTEIRDSEIRGNQASSAAGALYIMDADVHIENSLITENSADSMAGTVYISTQSSPSTAASLTLIDTLISDNTAPYYAALYAAPSSSASSVTISCERTGSGAQGGFLRNENTGSSGSFGAITMVNYIGSMTFSSSGCDFGAEGSADDNIAHDISYTGSGPSSHYDFDDGATFTCSSGTRSCL